MRTAGGHDLAHGNLLIRWPGTIRRILLNRINQLVMIDLMIREP